MRKTVSDFGHVEDEGGECSPPSRLEAMSDEQFYMIVQARKDSFIAELESLSPDAEVLATLIAIAELDFEGLDPLDYV